MSARLVVVFCSLFCVVWAQIHSTRGFPRPNSRVRVQPKPVYPQEPSGYDGNNDNWPAALVIDTSNISNEAAAQHDLFYGGGGSADAMPGRSFVEEDRPRTTPVEERVSPTTTRPTSTSTNTPTPRPEFTPTTFGERRTTVFSEVNDYDGRQLPVIAAVRDSRRRVTTPNPYEDNEDQRMVTKLMNIDNRSRYTADAGDLKPESYETNERATALMSRDREHPPSPFNETSEETLDSNRVRKINEILSRRLNQSDLPLSEDENWQRTTLNIARLLHDEAVANQNKAEASLKVTKKVRIIHLPPMPNDADSEEIVLVGERGNATIHRGRSNMFMSIHGSSMLKRH